RLTAAAVTQGDALLPPDDVERAETVRLGLDAALREAPALRRLLAAAAAVRDWLGVRADTAAAERAIAAVLAAGQDVRVLEVAGTWGTYDLEITHHFF